MNIQATTQPTYRVQPPTKSDKTRQERREQERTCAAIYKAQTSKRERKVHFVIVLLLLVVVVDQICIAAGWITSPGYL